MRIFKTNPLLKSVNEYLVDSGQPSNISYLWNFGSLLGFCLGIQIVTGVTLAMHYSPSILEAFNSVEHIMRDVNSGWLVRYLHSNTASAFFFIVYLHIGRGLYYGSYKTPRTLVWSIGTVIFILMIGTAFLGYVLPFGQMSLWGATVITNLMSAIPWVGEDIVEFIWGGFSVNSATLNRFFSLHFLLPFILAGLALMHLISLHAKAGSGNPLGVSGNYDRLPFAPYFVFKDLITLLLFILVLSIIVFFVPNYLGDSENYVMANPMQTPPAIVPEWYLLPFYAILRSIPNKLIGVIFMFSAILALLTMRFTDVAKLRGIAFKPLNKLIFFLFVGNFLILMELGAKHVESPFIELGQLSTLIYFLYFLALIPSSTIYENGMKMFLGYYKKVKKNNVISDNHSVIRNNTDKANLYVSLPVQSVFYSKFLGYIGKKLPNIFSWAFFILTVSIFVSLLVKLIIKLNIDTSLLYLFFIPVALIGIIVKTITHVTLESLLVNDMTKNQYKSELINKILSKNTYMAVLFTVITFVVLYLVIPFYFNSAILDTTSISFISVLIGTGLQDLIQTLVFFFNYLSSVFNNYLPLFGLFNDQPRINSEKKSFELSDTHSMDEVERPKDDFNHFERSKHYHDLQIKGQLAKLEHENRLAGFKRLDKDVTDSNIEYQAHKEYYDTVLPMLDESKFYIDRLGEKLKHAEYLANKLLKIRRNYKGAFIEDLKPVEMDQSVSDGLGEAMRKNNEYWRRMFTQTKNEKRAEQWKELNGLTPDLINYNDKANNIIAKVHVLHGEHFKKEREFDPDSWVYKYFGLKRMAQYSYNVTMHKRNLEVIRKNRGRRIRFWRR